MDRQNRFGYWGFVPMPIRVPIERISRPHRAQCAGYAVSNKVAMFAAGERHVSLANLEQRIAVPLTVFILHRHTVLADVFNVHANAIVTAVFADEAAVPAILRIDGHHASEATGVVLRRIVHDDFLAHFQRGVLPHGYVGTKEGDSVPSGLVSKSKH